MSTIYVFELVEGKYYITEFKNDVIEPIKSMIKKLIPENEPIKFNSLLTQNLGAIISSIEWIQKYSIKTIAEIKENKNLENIFMEYVKKYTINNVRSDVYKELELSDSNIKYIENILNESKESPLKRIQFIDNEITKLKSANDFIKKNIESIDKFLNYNIYYEIEKFRNKQFKNQDNNNLFQNTSTQIQYKIQQEMQQMQQKMQHMQQLHRQQNIGIIYLNKSYPKPKSDLIYINTLIPNFIDNYIELKMKPFTYVDINIKPILEEHFCNHVLAKEISTALLSKMKCDKLMLQYGTFDEINNKLSKLYYKKCELLHMLETEEIKVDINNKEEIKINKVLSELESDEEE